MNITIILKILNQYGGPIHLSNQTKRISNITENLVNYHKNNISHFSEYNVSDLYSLYGLLEYALNDLGDDEFSIVTGMNLYSDGYKILQEIKNMIIQK